MNRHLALAFSAFLFLLGAPALAVDIFVDSLTVIEYDQDTLVGPFYEVDITAASGSFQQNGNTWDVSSPANNGNLIYEGDFGAQEGWFLDETFSAGVGSNLTITMGGANSASLVINQNVGAVSGLPTISAFNIVGTDLIVNWDCSTCIQGANATANFLGISAFDIATDGDDFDEFVIINAPMGLSGQTTIDLSAAAPGQYSLEAEFFSQASFSDAVSDPGNTWNVIHGRSVLNGGYDFTVVPEPGTGLLLGMGIAGLAATRRRR